MKHLRFLMVVVCTLCVVLLAQQHAAGQSPPDDGTTLLLLLEPGADMGRVESMLQEVNSTVVKRTTIKNTGHQILRVQTDPGKLADMENHLRAYGDPNISAVERNHIAHFEGTLERETEYETEHETEHETGCPPNDPFFSEQWALPDLHFPTADVVDALAWCIDHQRERRGPGPINVSINIDPPFTYNSSPFIQALAKALRAQGDLFVQGAGNSGLEDPTPEQFIRRVAATDEHDQLASFSVFGPFQVAAPGVDILTFGGNNAVAFLSGTSLSTAYWSGPIAFLMSLCPKLTAPAADAILFNTATVTKQGYHIPNLEAARDRGDSD